MNALASTCSKSSLAASVSGQERKEDRETEKKLIDLQEQHSTLTQSYQALQLDYSAIKWELERLRNQHENESATRRSFSIELGGQEGYGGEIASPLMFDASVFCNDLEKGDLK